MGSSYKRHPFCSLGLQSFIIITCISEEEVFICGIFFLGGGDPPTKKLIFPNGYRLCALNLFWPDSEFQIYHGNFL